MTELDKFEAKTLGRRVWLFRHKEYGHLTITRDDKSAKTNSIEFTLQLKPPKKTLLTEVETLYVSNELDDSTSSVGYGTIMLNNMAGYRVIYPLHHAYACTGMELGVAQFKVLSICNINLGDKVIPNCGMHPQDTGGAGPCVGVQHSALLASFKSGWH